MKSRTKLVAQESAEKKRVEKLYRTNLKTNRVYTVSQKKTVVPNFGDNFVKS